MSNLIIRRIQILLLILFLVHPNTQGQDTWIFEFSEETHAIMTNLITEPVQYSRELGFGFDFESGKEVIIKSSRASKTGYCTSPVPIYISALVPEGSYEVKIKIGNPEKRSQTTIKAEARRLLLLNHNLKKGRTEEFTFIVNVRSPVIIGTDSIRLKSREYNYMNWDDRLTLEFSGLNHAVQRIEIKPAKKVKTLYLAGNSTVTDQDLEPWASWGQMITAYFDQGVSVANFAESGETLASFKGRKRLEKVMTLIQPGDYLFIEFGHNDQKMKGDGIGPWTSFSDLLKEYIAHVREKGAVPVLITPTQRRTFDETGKIRHTHGDYPEAMRKVAKEMGVELIDLNEMSKTLYEAWGPEDSKKAFVHYPAGSFPGQEKELKDNTHFSTYGAHEIALCILKSIRDQGLELGDHIVNFPSDYVPSAPTEFKNWHLPVSQRYVSKKPEGN